MCEQKICTRCIMDNSVSDISFDENGICNYCREYEFKAKKLPTGEIRDKKLKNVVSIIKEKGKNKKYDCIIGVSGGVDSTYTAYLTKKQGLRPLAIHLDNGWNSELSVANIEKTLKILDIDLYTHVIDWEEFRDLQLSFIKSSITNLEIPTDHAITAILFRKASEIGVKFILSGNNTATEAIQPSNWGEYNKDLRLIRGIHKRFGSLKLKTYPTIGLVKFAYYALIKNIKQISILDLVDYNKDQAISILQKELGWKYYGGKHYESIFTRFFQGYILPQKYNVDKRMGHFSTLIMSGQISREEALSRMRDPAYPDEMYQTDKEYFLKKFGLSSIEFEQIMRFPIKTDKDYPSNRRLFETFGNLINLFKLYAKTSS